MGETFTCEECGEVFYGSLDECLCYDCAEALDDEIED